MLIPYWTDAEIKHWPIATVVLIVINILAFPIQMSLPDIEVSVSSDQYEEGSDELSIDDLVDRLQNRNADPDEIDVVVIPGWVPYALSHGEGLHPIQWLTSFFMHAGIGHLLGNMLFLWIFGLVVEARVGGLVFAGLYMFMGIFQNIVEQVIFLLVPAMPSLGASSAIYAVMMIAMLWSPQENIKAIIFVFYRPFFFDVPVAMWAVFYFLIDFGSALFSGFGMGTGLLHIMGGVVGVVVGAVFLVIQWVDCDGNDILSMTYQLFGKQRKLKPKQLTKHELKEKQQLISQREQRIETLRKSIAMHLGVNNVGASIEQMKQLRRVDPNASWEEPQLAKLISHFAAEKNWDSVIEYSNRYLVLYEKQSAAIRINLAKIYLFENALPRKSLKTLSPIQVENLPPAHVEIYNKLVAEAKRQIAAGTLEFGD